MSGANNVTGGGYFPNRGLRAFACAAPTRRFAATLPTKADADEASAFPTHFRDLAARSARVLHCEAI